MTNKLMCSNCGFIGDIDDFLEAPDPFETGYVIQGCPECKSVLSEARFEPVCDEPGCNATVTCGWNDKEPGVYRKTCRKHYKHYD